MMSICCSLSKLLPRDAGRGGTGPVFGRSVNPIPSKGADYAHHITASTPGFENLTTSLFGNQEIRKIYQRLKSVHFKKTVARISILSKLWYFLICIESTTILKESRFAQLSS